MTPRFKIITWDKFVNNGTYSQTARKKSNLVPPLVQARNRRNKPIPKMCFSPSVLLLRSSKITTSLHVSIIHTSKDYPIINRQTPNWERKHSSALSLTTALVGSGWSTPHPRSLPPRKKNHFPIYMRLDESQGRSGREWNISPPPVFDPQTVQAVASRYTDYAILAHP